MVIEAHIGPWKEYPKWVRLFLRFFVRNKGWVRSFD